MLLETSSERKRRRRTKRIEWEGLKICRDRNGYNYSYLYLGRSIRDDIWWSRLDLCDSGRRQVKGLDW